MRLVSTVWTHVQEPTYTQRKQPISNLLGKIYTLVQDCKTDVGIDVLTDFWNKQVTMCVFDNNKEAINGNSKMSDNTMTVCCV